SEGYQRKATKETTGAGPGWPPWKQQSQFLSVETPTRSAAETAPRQLRFLPRNLPWTPRSDASVVIVDDVRFRGAVRVVGQERDVELEGVGRLDEFRRSEGLAVRRRVEHGALVGRLVLHRPAQGAACDIGRDLLLRVIVERDDEVVVHDLEPEETAL